MPKRSPLLQSEDGVNKQFGARLRMCREAAGKSQTEVGEALGVSFQQVQKYENGATSISLNRLFDVAAYLRITMIKLLDGLDDLLPEQSLASGVAEDAQAPFLDDEDLRVGAGAYSKQKVALLNAFNRIHDQKVRRSVVSMVEALSEVCESEAVKKMVEN